MHAKELTFFFLFLAFILSVLMLDLGIFNRKSHVIRLREATMWSLLWISLAVGFFFLMRTHGEIIHGIDNNVELKQVVEKYGQPIQVDLNVPYEQNLLSYRNNLSLEFITGYLIEYSLSVDNVFVILLIFLSFAVQQKYYHRILFWGILGAIIMRFLFIFICGALVQQFEWVLYIFGGFLIFTGIKMFLSRKEDDKIDTQNHPVVKFSAKYFPVYPKIVRGHFFVRKNKHLLVTPIFVVLLVIEFSDVVFAVDSVPAIFSVTKDVYIVFFSNIFAILGLRSLFFLVMNMFNYFHYLKDGLSVLLTFIGVKMVIAQYPLYYHIPTNISLYVILGILTVSILASVLFPPKEKKKAK
jgi:tellurite resistance protein TerC